ncbi:cell division protein ZapA [Tepidamorphus gemmatus]|jgi:cell division protein ZapA|uniref:Cell division protein ZapA n=1 Tax=Tepidamorphus gemmatus TaxID=747076 RepID=A0A4R3MHS7_9HYPH|nr:cell division protein ZapA [Tepidamorphus gemmatus]TCT13317.1 cell division protein ZapA [Tepidamorphus gemmatus]
MPQVTISINSRVYRMGCDEGQEQILIDLARDIDARIERYKTSFGEVGDMRLLLMAAMEMGDELGELRRRFDALEAEVETLRQARAAAADQFADSQERMAATLDETASRIERLAAALNGAPAED